METLTLDEMQLESERRFTTKDFALARNYVERTTEGRFEIVLRHDCDFRQYKASSAALGNTLFSLVNVDSESGYDIEMMGDPDLILLQVLVRGTAEFRQGSIRVDVAPSQMVLLEAMSRSHKRWHGPTQLLIVRMSRKRLEQIVAGEAGIAIHRPLSFGVLRVFDLQRVPTLWNFLVTICRDLSTKSPSFCGPAGVLAERTLALLLLKAVSNNYDWAFATGSLASSAPYYVRRVESYIQKHATEPISSKDLTDVAGVSARSVYQGFKRFRSTTPMGYLKAVRLELARHALIRNRAKGPVSVTEAAFATGYTNLSQFSRDYKERFHEAPSETLLGR